MTVPQVTKRYQCKQCLAVAELPADADVHTRTWCGCCTQQDTDPAHHHGETAAACSPEAHGGEPCWNPPAVPKPDGCTVCRPIIHYAVAGELRMT